MKIAAVIIAAVLLGGCVGHGSWGQGVGLPRIGSLPQAARKAAIEPQTWVPLLTAGLLLAADVDDKWSEDMVEDQSLFGDADDAHRISSELLDVLAGTYVLSALLAPSPTVAAKAKGLAVGAGTVALGGVLSNGLKALTDRERPSLENRNSMPSGHAFKASTLATMALRNTRHIEMSNWSRQVTSWSVHGMAVGVGLARVEAGKHHLSDVFVGYALGNFLASFMYEVFLEDGSSDAMITFQPVESGGALTLQVPLR